MSAYRVSEGTQVHHAGVTYAAGEVFEASDGAVSQHVAAGWLVLVKKVETKPARQAGRKTA